ncbi:TIGR03862 family flavoprotein [Crocinitomix catalasitica]|uniref:TIGR03862 family flavoprotein n=1 Tax=Crocinitomix catalasitica TaxID=184607 RepID=UPI00047F8C03|nr:TIGR03862 family flavoprotein [Crocinitomix catalasitica]
MKQTIALIGGGPANLMAAYWLSKKHHVLLFEKGKTIGRKFLVAGNGGFNLTNSALADDLHKVYTPKTFLQPFLQQFDSKATIDWLNELGIETFIGSSGRVFPVDDIKPRDVLLKLKNVLIEQGVEIFTHHEFVGFDDSHSPILQFENEKFTPKADRYIFGLGGASWKITGANQKWLPLFDSIGVKTIPFQSSNAGININLPENFYADFAGKPLKNIAVKIGDTILKGEALITKTGLEGNAIYPIVPHIRKGLETAKEVPIFIDFKPNNSLESLLAKVKNKKIQTKNYKFVFNLTSETLFLIKNSLSKTAYLDPYIFVETIKNTRLNTYSIRPIEESISTVGGIDTQEIAEDLWLNKHPHLGVIGEMIDWDAPTGGFLLQACFSMGFRIGNSI